MPRQIVHSEAISSVEYFERGSTLEVEFRDGQIWRYAPVDRERFVELMAAESVGQYFNRHIRDHAQLRVRVR